MEFSLLAEQPSAASTVAKWYFDEWCRDTGRYPLEFVQKNVAAATNIEKAPMLILCHIGNDLVGAAELKIREMDAFPEYEFWLGGVYVRKDFRGHGIGSALVAEALKRALNANIKKLYLQTENLSGGLYTKFGFNHLHQVDSKGVYVTVMCADTGV
ncbi:GNAT family N-acetyltransferase [Shewanella sp. 0m-8]